MTKAKNDVVAVRYTGMAAVRSYVGEDFSRHGITDQGDVEFNHANRWTAEVSQQAAGYLIGTGEFTKVSMMQDRPNANAPKSEWEDAVRNSGGDVTDDMTVQDLKDAYDELERRTAEQAGITDQQPATVTGQVATPQAGQGPGEEPATAPSGDTVNTQSDTAADEGDEE